MWNKRDFKAKEKRKEKHFEEKAKERLENWRRERIGWKNLQLCKFYSNNQKLLVISQKSHVNNKP